MDVQNPPLMSLITLNSCYMPHSKSHGWIIGRLLLCAIILFIATLLIFLQESALSFNVIHTPTKHCEDIQEKAYDKILFITCAQHGNHVIHISQHKT